MSFDPKSLVTYFDLAAGTIGTLAASLPQPASAILGYVAAALKLGSDIAASGADPLVVIQRIHAADADLASVEDAWQRELYAEYGPAGKSA